MINPLEQPLMLFRCCTHGIIKPNQVRQIDGLPFCPYCDYELDDVDDNEETGAKDD